MFGDNIARTITMILIAAAVFTAVQAISGLITRASSKRKVNKRLAVAETLESELQVMPKQQLESVLRGVFEEDEWILVALGGVLGGAIGLWQGALVLYLQ